MNRKSNTIFSFHEISVMRRRESVCVCFMLVVVLFSLKSNRDEFHGAFHGQCTTHQIR